MDTAIDLKFFFDKLDNSKKVLVGIGGGILKGKTSDETVELYNMLASILSEKDWFVVDISKDTSVKKSKLDLSRVAMPFDDEITLDENEAKWNEYTQWLQQTLNRDLLLLELGVGFDVPTLVRWPFEKIATLNNKAFLYRINESFPQLPDDIGDKGISIKSPVGELLETIYTERFGN